MRQHYKHLTVVATVFLSVSVIVDNRSAVAQTLEPARGDVYGLGGFYHGAGLTTGAVGGGAAYPVHRRVRVFGETYYFSKDISEELGFSGIEARGSALSFEGGVHVTFPLDGARAVPFVMGGFGFARAKAEVEGRLGRRIIRESGTETLGHLGIGGGLDYYASNKWGIRPEFRWYSGNEVRVTSAVFYRF